MRRFFSVTLPMISGAVFFIVIMQTISALQMFDQAYTMFYGAQQKATASDESLFYMVYLFQQAFQFFKMGYASAMAWLLFVIIMVITTIQVRAGNRFVYYEGEARAMTDVQARHPEIIQGTTASAVTPPRSRWRPQGNPRGWGRAAYLFVLTVAVVVFVYPLVWLVSASVKPKEQVFDNRLWPQEIRLQNFVDVWNAGPVLQWLVNSGDRQRRRRGRR